MRTSKPNRRRAKPVTIRDVAREAGVSVASVHRAVNGHLNVTAATRERVLAVVERLHYVPNNGARSLVTRRTHVIGVLLPDLWGDFFSELIRGIDAAAREKGLHLLLSSFHGNTTDMAAAIRAMSGRVEGLLIMAPHVDASSLHQSLSDSLPIVFMNSRVDRTQSSLSIDSYKGARAVVRHLVACGRRKIAHIAGPEDNFDSQERLRGYRDELVRSAPKLRPLVMEGDFTERSGYVAGARLAVLADRPDAVFAANDMMAVGCLAALAEAGLEVPRDIGVAGFDDIPLAAFIRPALTTARARISDLGRSALRQLSTLIESPYHLPPTNHTFEPELIVRESCGAGRAGRDATPPHSANHGGHDGSDDRKNISRDDTGGGEGKVR